MFNYKVRLASLIAGILKFPPLCFFFYSDVSCSIRWSWPAETFEKSDEGPRRKGWENSLSFYFLFLLFSLLFFFFPFSFLFFFFYSNNTFRDRFGSSVKSRTFRDVVTKLRALQLQTPNSPYDPALFRKPQSLYSWDDRATRFCGTSAPTENSTPKLHFLRCGERFPWFEDNAKLLIFPAC